MYQVYPSVPSPAPSAVVRFHYFAAGVKHCNRSPKLLLFRTYTSTARPRLGARVMSPLQVKLRTVPWLQCFRAPLHIM